MLQARLAEQEAQDSGESRLRSYKEIEVSCADNNQGYSCSGKKTADTSKVILK